MRERSVLHQHRKLVCLCHAVGATNNSTAQHSLLAGGGSQAEGVCGHEQTFQNDAPIILSSPPLKVPHRA